MISAYKLPFLILAMLILGLATSISGQNTVVFNIQDSYGQSEVEVPISVENFNNILGFQLGLKFDEEVLEFVDLTSEVLAFQNYNYNLIDDQLLISYTEQNSVPLSTADGSTILNLKFKVLKVEQTEIYYDENILAKEMISNIGVVDFDINSGFVNENGSGVEFSIFFDENKDCEVLNDVNLNDWPVAIWDGSQTWYRFSNSEGYVKATLNPGNYSLQVLHPDFANTWTACEDNINFTVEDGNINSLDDISIQINEDCPILNLEMSTPRLRRCFDNTIYVNACNNGIEADDLYTEITLAPELIMVSSSIPFTDLGDNKYRFEIGSLTINECKSFNYRVNVDCDATELGQTLCIDAEILPEVDCDGIVNWDGPQLRVSGECVGDNINFTILNEGNEDMSVATAYTIIEDDLIMPHYSQEVQIESGQFEVIQIPADGKTLRLEIPQINGHPYPILLNSFVEKCGQGVNGEISYGFATMFPNSRSKPNQVRLCEEVTGSWDPNDKAANPKGYREQHYLNANTTLDYKIRFQNTGTDTAFNIVVRDSISSELDLATLNVGTASHHFTYEIINQNIIEFRFDNIMLPDSNINEAASHGFVSFTLEQEEDLEDGTMIYNQAEIYFDFNEPIITNQVFHTIGEEFVLVSIASTKPNNNLNLKASPNPFIEQTKITFNNTELQFATLEIFDLHGKQIITLQGNQDHFFVSASNLSKGVYFYQLSLEDQLLDTGKLIRH